MKRLLLLVLNVTKCKIYADLQCILHPIHHEVNGTIDMTLSIFNYLNFTLLFSFVALYHEIFLAV